MPKKSSAQPRPNLKVPPRGIGPISELNKNDVLSGRGGRINAHDGNIRFREICQDYKKDYLAPTTKKLEKAHIAAGIVDSIRAMDPPGRFLKEDPDGTWWDIGDFKAIKKVGQALREDAPEIRTENKGDSSDDESPKLVTSYVSPSGIPTTFNTQLPRGERSTGHMPPPSQVPSTVASSVQKQYTIGESGPVFHDYSGQAAQLGSQQPVNTLQNFQNDQYAQYEHQQSQQAPNIYDARQMYQGANNDFNKALPENSSNRQVAFGREFVPTGSSATTLTVSTVSGLSDPSKLLNTGEPSNFSGAPPTIQAGAPAATALAAAVPSHPGQSMGGVPVLPTGLHNAVSMGTGEDLIRSQQEKTNGRTSRDNHRNSIHYQQLTNDPRRLSSLSGMSDLTLSIMSLDQSFGLTRSNSNPDLTQSLRNLFQRESSNKSISDATVDALASEDHLMQDSWNQLGTSGSPAELVNFVAGSNRTMITKESGGSGNSNDTSLGTSSASAQSNAVPPRRPSFSRFRATSTGSTTGMSIGSQQSLFSKTSDASWRVNAQLLAAQGDDGSVKSIMSELSADIMALDLADPYRRGPAFG
mmetsp:Transcript_19784/g.30537  ORF Transcript_19784/g.30537 Transcript_19784/m.30537 type:complete len:583 (+) Transcript_19784:227-1975(+)|eukprot:CAMPEP_0195295892 /NCGR_PEP_ID=MMETSP0707-20130614/18264_1 /TAXON_ID=33640 /ORGANISM="Asterionellopsis glacialis, Strain CCMP134" /LENGTH=582 /DNA_ID=CAMNT_0040357229 /DNA_START=217 /DNA_END=1965 /DNA_ORIENTATION=-